MWITNLKIKHDCIIGNRCKEFGITEIGIPFNVFIEKGVTYSPQIQTLHGDQERIDKYIKDIKKDKRVTNFEREGSTIFLVEVRRDKIPATYHHNKIIFTKPVFTDKEGYEHWEIASWKKSILTEFIIHMEKQKISVEIKKIKQTKLDDIYFAHLQPKLTPSQKKAIELAFENGYYEWPKRTDLGNLAKKMKVSIPTFREHLKRAEAKIMPNIIKSI
jgi:predicted DNA binding protein